MKEVQAGTKRVLEAISLVAPEVVTAEGPLTLVHLSEEEREKIRAKEAQKVLDMQIEKDRAARNERKLHATMLVRDRTKILKKTKAYCALIFKKGFAKSGIALEYTTKNRLTGKFSSPRKFSLQLKPPFLKFNSKPQLHFQIHPETGYINIECSGVKIAAAALRALKTSRRLSPLYQVSMTAILTNECRNYSMDCDTGKIEKKRDTYLPLEKKTAPL
jgi:ATP-dependent protease HslVU (ClpYQ) peptidase subunit